MTGTVRLGNGEGRGLDRAQDHLVAIVMIDHAAVAAGVGAVVAVETANAAAGTEIAEMTATAAALATMHATKRMQRLRAVRLPAVLKALVGTAPLLPLHRVQ